MKAESWAGNAAKFVPAFVPAFVRSSQKRVQKRVQACAANGGANTPKDSRNGSKRAKPAFSRGAIAFLYVYLQHTYIFRPLVPAVPAFCPGNRFLTETNARARFFPQTRKNVRACALFIYAYLWRGKSGYSGYKPHSLRPMCAHLATQLCALGESAQTLLFPLFYALSALNADRAYLQVAPTAPGVA